ncbi:hypothetical protein CERSUDRAFT_79892 [Gelatoporia subvermispora B]|uniref:Uncharacterized protein n=1 Tax=Ceriporiopsis subvermispora (strain B) TaxID=914234 RepID=M2QYR7_CERS8|nr:hypothetical protein CERSUDRAFT_79892 [Gelatoporia subvermispora B]
MLPVEPGVSESPRPWPLVFARKGGGGGHASSHGSSSKGGGGSSEEGGGEESSGKSGSSSSSGNKGVDEESPSSRATTSVPLTGATGGRKYQATSYSAGGGSTATIPKGQPFAGLSQGGGSRTTIYGSRIYGSGYPGTRYTYIYIYQEPPIFPYVYWPISWGPGYGYGPPFWHTGIYGLPDNSSRPGGPMAFATFTSNTTNSTFHVLSDNSTVSSLITSITVNCTLGPGSSTSPTPYNGTNMSEPVPEQTIQYFRASTVALTLDGYNNTNAFTQGPNATADPLPSWVDNTLLNCLNATIGEAVPLVTLEPHKKNVGAIVGGVIGGLVGAILLIFLTLWCLDRRDRYKAVPEKEIDGDSTWNTPTLQDESSMMSGQDYSYEKFVPQPTRSRSIWSRLNPARLWKK